MLTRYRLGAPVPVKGNFVTKWSPNARFRSRMRPVLVPFRGRMSEWYVVTVSGSGPSLREGTLFRGCGGGGGGGGWAFRGEVIQGHAPFPPPPSPPPPPPPPPASEYFHVHVNPISLNYMHPSLHGSPHAHFPLSLLLTNLSHFGQDTLRTSWHVVTSFKNIWSTPPHFLSELNLTEVRFLTKIRM